MNLTVNAKLKERTPSPNIFNYMCLAIDAWAIPILLKTNLLFAASDDKILTDLFDSEATRGSWNWFTKFNTIGMVLNYIISLFCFIGIMSIAFQSIITIIYFVMRPFWDEVHERQSAHMNEKFFGLGGGFKDAFNSVRGPGFFNAMITIAASFLPDIYQISEMNDNKAVAGLSDEDTIATWFVKTFPRKVLAILLLSMSFNGSLLKCYGLFVDGASAFMDRAVSYNTAALVNKWLDSGDNFEFSIGDDGTNMGKVQEAICSKIYSYALSKTGITDASLKQQIGANIQETVKNSLGTDGMVSLLVNNGQSADLTLSDEDWGYIKYTVTCNSDSSNGNSSWSIPLSQVVPSGEWNTESYVHVTPILKRKAPTHDYINS